MCERERGKEKERGRQRKRERDRECVRGIEGQKDGKRERKRERVRERLRVKYVCWITHAQNSSVLLYDVHGQSGTSRLQCRNRTFQRLKIVQPLTSLGQLGAWVGFEKRLFQWSNEFIKY